MLERALSGQDSKGLSAREVAKRYGLPEEALERLEKLEVLTPRVRNGSKRYGPADVQIIEAVSRMRASGYSEALGFTVYDTLIYKRHLEQLVREEVEVMMERVAGEMDTEAGGRAARARGRADARPGRGPAREAARRGAAGAPRRAVLAGATETSPLWRHKCRTVSAWGVVAAAARPVLPGLRDVRRIDQ